LPYSSADEENGDAPMNSSADNQVFHSGGNSAAIPPEKAKVKALNVHWNKTEVSS